VPIRAKMLSPEAGKNNPIKNKNKNNRNLIEFHYLKITAFDINISPLCEADF